MRELPSKFVSKYQALLGKNDAAALFTAIASPSKKAFRVNPLKSTAKQYADSQVVPVPGITEAYYGQVSGQDPEWISGLVYSQEPAAMFPGQIADVKAGERVLDLCAAPGGKSLFLGEKLQDQGLLVANEISTARAKTLRENIERWGLVNVLVTNESPAKLASKFTHFFDKIVVDAPCSGEGMFRKNSAAMDYWSPEYVLTCQKRQQEILTAAVKMLRPGGQLIYSTCTFSPEEDEQVVSWLVEQFDFKIMPLEIVAGSRAGRPEWGQQLPDLAGTLRFWPQDNLGEGQYVAKLRAPLVDVTPTTENKPKKRQHKHKPTELSKGDNKLVAEILEQFNLPVCLTNWQNLCQVSNDHVFLPAYKGQNLGLRILKNGLELGVLKKKRFEPGQQLAQVLNGVPQERVIDLNQDEYASYLHGETIASKSKLRGFVLISYHGLIFSFGKMTGNGILKNFYPKGLRTIKKGYLN
ncbi:RsmB/NOP family class I SAM-dependent RNA methyltransferase [Lactobacillus sp. ESL0681]|uniref:RsmB/NOP family class I SAM-dependent RNA methyltransferase n=1 Tax=Lactobacillus sp. ESL0681 TaxID=2983211 RepID=UPI0023F72042|nr:RsmB/NOP family class I SAM-dependent RNA methyltransferase [Lactobacillus sp. ESL0681]WEV40703.1 RsmF rRNA methyltransferase first C-terminal domain-containing protein [Lactobacillus sp. ESL0681]